MSKLLQPLTVSSMQLAHYLTISSSAETTAATVNMSHSKTLHLFLDPLKVKVAVWEVSPTECLFPFRARFHLTAGH